MKFPLPRLLAFLLLFGVFSSGAFAANYTLQLVDNTGLDPSQYSIYAMGFSTASQLVLSSNGTFVSQSSGTISSYKVGSGGLTQILLDTDTNFTGGRLYFFVAPAGSPAPSVAYGQQPTNPPNATYPPYTIVEITVPAGSPATADVQTVDGFIFPITLTLNGQTNVAGQQYGQPVYASGQPAVANRAAIFSAYASFMNAEGSAGAPYLDMVFGSFAGQSAGILNPGAYLTAVNGSNEYLNLASPLNAAFDVDLATLFSTTTLSVQGVASNPAGIPPQPYAATPVTQIYPGTSVSLPALKFTNGGTEFYVFNPTGISVLTNDAGGEIRGTVNGTTLTLDSPASGLASGMYVAGAGTGQSDGLSTTQIATVNGSTSVTLAQNLGTPAPHSQYLFSKLPQLTMFQTPGQMAFANSGVFADSTIQYAAGSAQASVLGNLENQIVSALNRGVAVNATALNPGAAGGTSAIWGDQTKWYPASATQNLFSLFMHVGAVGGTPIFFQPANAAAWPNARGQAMGSAYGFAYDENGGPVPPAPSGQPEVPTKFDQNVPVGATIQLTFGQWTGAVPAPSPTPSSNPAAIAQAQRDLKTLARETKKAKSTLRGAIRTQTLRQLKFAQKVARYVIGHSTNSAGVSLLAQSMKATKVRSPAQRAKKFKQLEKKYKKLV